MNSDLKNSLKELGWSDELIRAASAVSEQVAQSAVESVGSNMEQVLSTSTTDRNDVRILPESSNTFVSFSLYQKAN